VSQVDGAGGRWTEASVPGQSGRTAVVTGANAGIGFEAARVLAERGARVVLACRDPAKARDATARIARTAPAATVEFVHLDLGSLASVRGAAEDLGSRFERLDLLINNGGVMAPPRQVTADGFELQLAVNHLGPFALSGLLLGLLLKAEGSRIVTVSSLRHRQGTINFDDLQSSARYRARAAYAQSKLANLLFTYELQRRLSAAGARTLAVAAHPGVSSTQLFRHAPAAARAVQAAIGPLVMQSAQMGALPVLRAATDPAAPGGGYYGPGGRGEMRGFPRRTGSSARSHEAGLQQRLWEASQQLTGVTYSV
jgi:NAD(P)-dependent dehydrogenase (short-subunit alcohol dehydrogenase family)